jgi:anti-sigma B factor antagonist
MEIEATDVDEVTVVAVSGEVDASSSPDLRARLDELTAQGRERLVVDLGGVGFLDSSGLATLVHAFKRVRIGNGDLQLCNLQPEVAALFALTRLDRVFTIHPGRVEAIEAVAEAGR